MRHCRTCGADLEAGANFCGHCGSAITITTPAVSSDMRTRVTSAVAVPPGRPIAPPPKASVSVRYGPEPLRAPSRQIIQRPPTPRHATYPKSRFLAATLEWIFPGFGVMYAGRFWTGALVLLSTFLATGVAFSVALSNSSNAQLEDVVNFVVWLFVAHLIWLVFRMIWAWRLASRATRLARLSP